MPKARSRDGGIPAGRVPEERNLEPKDPIRPSPLEIDMPGVGMEGARRTEAGLFRIALSRTDDRDVGWLGWTDDRWARVVTNVNDALSLQRYVYKDKTYYCVGPDVTGPQWKWLSVSKQGRVGFYA